MIEIPMVFVAGVLGSSHCLGMCGPFALAIGSTARRWPVNLCRQSLYTIGRVFTYSFFGAMAGFAGGRLQSAVPLFVNVAAVLAIVAGLFLIHQGLLATGILQRRAVSGEGGPCLAGGFLATLLRSESWYDVFLAGLFTGFIPCSLVYAFVAIAASTGSLTYGASLMIAFGLGTAPMMMLTGFSGSILSLSWRRQLFRFAAWCVVLTGVLSIARGVGAVSIPGVVEGSGCPLCP